MGYQKYLEANENKNTTDQNLWDATLNKLYFNKKKFMGCIVETVFRRKLMAVNAYSEKNKKGKTSNQ